LVSFLTPPLEGLELTIVGKIYKLKQIVDKSCLWVLGGENVRENHNLKLGLIRCMILFTQLLLCVAAVLGAANAGVIGAPAAVSYAAPAVGYAAPTYGYAAPAYGYAAPAYGYAAVATPTLTSQSSNTLRTFGNQGQISHEAKSIQTPFSSVTRSDTRVSNDAQILAHTYAAPAVAHTYAAPAVATYAAAPAITKTITTAPAATQLLGVAYSAAPAVAHMTYSNGLGISYSY